MINPFYFNHKVMKAGYNNNLDSHHMNHIKSKLTISPNYLANEKNDFIKLVKQRYTIYGGLFNQYVLTLKQYYQRDLLIRMKMIKYLMKLHYISIFILVRK